MKGKVIKHIVAIVRAALVISAIAFAVVGILDKDNQTDYFKMGNLMWFLNFFFNSKKYDS